MMRTTWWSVALLSAALVAAPGCKSTDTNGDEAPPPEVTAQDEGAEAGETGMEAGADAMAEAENGAEASAAAEAGEGTEAGEATEPSEAGASETGAETAETDSGAEAAAESGFVLVAVAGDDGTVSVQVGGEAVGSVAGGEVSEDLASWLKAHYESDSGAQITLEVPVSLKFDEVGMPLMKACFAAGFPPAQVTYKPVAK